MEDRKNRFSVIFGTTQGMMIAILLFSVAGVKLISGIISMISGGGLAILSFFMSLFSIAAIVVVAIGFLLSFLSGKKNEISPSGLMCIRVIVMIQGILTFIGLVISSVIMFFALIASIWATAEGAGGAGALLILISFLVLALCVFLAVLNLMYAMRVNVLLNSIRWYEQVQKPLKAGLIKVMTILSIVETVFGLIFSLITMISFATASSLIGTVGNLYDVDLDIVFSLVGFDTSSLVISNIISILISGIMIAVYVMVYIMLNKVQRFGMAGQNNRDVIPEKKEESVINEFGEDPTVPLDVFNGGDPDDNKTVIIDEPVDEPINIKPFIDEPEPIKGAIVALSGKESGYRYPMEDGEELIIGKDPSVAHIIVDSGHERISKKHCGVKWNAGMNQYQVIDYSTNGTYINSIRKLSKGLFVTVPKGTIINLGKDNVDFKLD